MDTESNNSTFAFDYDLSICSTETLTKYMITSITLATLGIVMQTTAAICCLLGKGYSRSGNVLITAIFVCNTVFVTFYTLAFVLQELSHCGWIQLNITSCKVIWWIRHLSFISGNFLLALSAHETNPQIRKSKEKGRPKRLIIGASLIVLLTGLFTSHYPVLGLHVRGQVKNKDELIISGFCTVDQRHTLVLEISEVTIGSVLPLLFFLANIIYCLHKKLNELFSKEKLVLPQENKRSEMERKISSRIVLTKQTNKDAPNLVFWTCMFLLTVFLLVPQRLMEFILFIQNNQVTWLAIGLNNSSNFKEKTWRILLIVSVFAPIVNSLFILPLYCFLTEQGRSYFKRLFGCREHDRIKSHPLQRQRPIRMHISADASMTRCYTISDVLSKEKRVIQNTDESVASLGYNI